MNLAASLAHTAREHPHQVLRQGDRSIGYAELRDFVKDQVAAYKYPRVVRLLTALPKGPTGKILKREIRLPDVEAAR